MKKTETEISSGAEKIEALEKEYTAENVDQKTEKSRSSSKETAKKAAVKKEKAAADKRVASAKARARQKEAGKAGKISAKQAKIEKKAAVKEKKLEKKKAIAEKKLARKEMIAQKKAERIAAKEKAKADYRAKRAEHKAEKAARREMLKNETKLEKSRRREREKKEKLANRRKQIEARERAREGKRKAREAQRERRAQERRHKREQRTERRKSGGYGGWLAAVISLGTACLVLAALVTAGAFRMNDMNIEAESGYRSTLYDMVAASEDLDASLGKLRVSAGESKQRALLTDVLVDSAIMENAIGKMPIDNVTGTDISGFVNRAGAYARSMLSKLSAGERLGEADREKISSLYETNDKLYRELNGLATGLSASEFKEFLAGGGKMAEKLSDMTKDLNSSIGEAPFAKEGNVGENRLTRLESISSSEAEERAMDYFKAYHVRDIRYTGETVTPDFSCYDFVLTDENGIEIYAQISKSGGKLVFFDTYEECTEKNFDLETADAIAREFLKDLGIKNVEAVWLSDGGMVANITYTAVQNGARIYPETIRVRVCEEKGRVVGMDAGTYLLNDKNYVIEADIGRDEAERSLAEGLEPYASNLAVISLGGKEVVAYEFACKYGGDEYIVYIDAITGEEAEIFRVVESARGRYLR